MVITCNPYKIFELGYVAPVGYVTVYGEAAFSRDQFFGRNGGFTQGDSESDWS